MTADDFGTKMSHWAASREAIGIFVWTCVRKQEIDDEDDEDVRNLAGRDARD